MSKFDRNSKKNRRIRPSRFILILLLIEFLDEFVFGIREAAWSLIQRDLALDYVQIGILLSVPGIVSNMLGISS